MPRHRVGALVLVLLSTLAGKVGAQFERCDQAVLGCGSSTGCSDTIAFGIVGGTVKTWKKTTTPMTGCSCNGNFFPVYQSYGQSGSQAFNEFLYYRCSTSKWGTAVTSGTDRFAPSSLPAHDTPYASTSMTQCPVSSEGTACAGPAPPRRISTPSAPGASVHDHGELKHLGHLRHLGLDRRNLNGCLQRRRRHLRTDGPLPSKHLLVLRHEWWDRLLYRVPEELDVCRLYGRPSRVEALRLRRTICRSELPGR